MQGKVFFSEINQFMIYLALICRICHKTSLFLKSNNTVQLKLRQRILTGQKIHLAPLRIQQINMKDKSTDNIFGAIFSKTSKSMLLVQSRRRLEDEVSEMGGGRLPVGVHTHHEHRPLSIVLQKGKLIFDCASFEWLNAFALRSQVIQIGSINFGFQGIIVFLKLSELPSKFQFPSEF